MGAPVCRIAPPPPTFSSDAPQLPTIPLISINPQNWNIPQTAAADMKNMAMAINIIRQVIMTLTNQGAGPNNVRKINLPFGGGGVTTNWPNDPGNKQNKTKPPKNKKQKQQKKQGAGFREVHRSMKKVRVFNPDDHSQYVDVNQVISLTMRDPVSGLTWTWNQGAPINPPSGGGYGGGSYGGSTNTSGGGDPGGYGVGSGGVTDGGGDPGGGD